MGSEMCIRDRLYKLLERKANFLLENRLFLIGDSAYCIESFLIPPYDNARPRTAEDDFNFFHSSARITVECAFGEIDLRWGIFWKRLSCTLDNAAIIIEGAMRLHNFLVDYRERHNCTNESFEDRHIFTQDVLNTNSMPLQTGNDLGRPRGRISFDEHSKRIEGMQIRDRLKQSLRDHQLYRPRKNEWYSEFSSHTYREE